MTKPCLTILATLAGVVFFAITAAAAAKKIKPGTETTPLSAEQIETNYTQAIEKRVSDILAVLDLKDEAKAGRIHDALIDQYRALRRWQAAEEAKGKSPPGQGTTDQSERDIQARNDRKALHDKFIARLSADLTPQQLEKMKNRMTYNKVKVTYDAYCEILPLTESQKGRVMEMLKEAREEAMDGTSSEEKSAIFKKYKGRINNYLTAEGYDVGKAYKDWGAKLKSKSAAKPAQPPAEPPE